MSREHVRPGCRNADVYDAFDQNHAAPRRVQPERLQRTVFLRVVPAPSLLDARKHPGPEVEDEITAKRFRWTIALEPTRDKHRFVSSRVSCLVPLGRARFEEPDGALAHRELGSTGCITLFTTYSPILSPMSVPTRVEKR